MSGLGQMDRAATVYFVRWPSVDDEDRALTKVGFTTLNRWQNWVRRGAEIQHLEHFGDIGLAKGTEQWCHKMLRLWRVPQAFVSELEARPVIGSYGCGFSECYLMRSHTMNRLISFVAGVGEEPPWA